MQLSSKPFFPMLPQSRHLPIFIAYPSSIDMQLGQVIQQLRGRRGLSQKQVALSVGIDRGQYSRIENDKVEPTLSTLRKIAAALEVPVSEFFIDGNALEVNSFEQPWAERFRLIEQLPEEKQQMVFTFIDTLVANQKLKATLSAVLAEVA